ncbi:MAG: hypothetical protein NC417_12970 [Candidatus Gastranaerophilales bacterium]|nr:hypothetical protein [Candidatus Gastranaerophilales bacterium]
MRKWLNEIRKPNTEYKLSNIIRNSLLILLLGIILGVFSKWLDNLSIYDNIWWQHVLGILDLRNVFSEVEIWLFIAITISVFSKTPMRASLNVLLFFIGMTISYHLYTIYFSGFNPMRYMMIWYGITLISPIPAYICWYAKSKNKISIIISSLIFCVMFRKCFSIGIWYFGLKSIIDLIIFIGTIAVMNVNPKHTFYSLTIAFILSFAVCAI